MRHYVIRFALLGLLLTACTPSAGTAPSSNTPSFETATLPPSEAPAATSPLQTPSTPTVLAPITGATTARLIVRTRPLSSSAELGILPAVSTIEILGKDPSGNWYKIKYAGGGATEGWVYALFVQVGGVVPVIASGDGATGAVREQVNVRSGPGIEYDAVGLLNPGDVVDLMAKDNAGTWLQIAFGAGPEGRGWVAASFIDSTGLDQLPVVSSSGQVMATDTPAEPSSTPMPILLTAPDDGDHLGAPGADVIFSSAGAGSILYSSDISGPDGDQLDWIRFTPYYGAVLITLECTGNGELSAYLTREGEDTRRIEEHACGKTTLVQLAADKPYLLELEIDPASFPSYVRYVLRIDGYEMP